MIARVIGKNYWDKNPAGIYLLKVSNRNNRTSCEMCLKLIKKDTRMTGFSSL